MRTLLRWPVWFFVLFGLVPLLLLALGCQAEDPASAMDSPTYNHPAGADPDLVEKDAGQPRPRVVWIQREDPYIAIRQASTWLGWTQGIFTIGAALLLVGSVFFPVIPRRAAGIALATSLGLALARYILLKYGVATAEVVFWISVAAAIATVAFVVVPAVIAWRQRLLAKVSVKLQADGDARAATALIAEAMPTVYGSPEARKSYLSMLTDSSPPSAHVGQ